MQMGTVSSLHPLLRGPPPFLGFAIFIMAQLEFRSASIYLFLNVYFIFIYVYICVLMCTGSYGGRKRVSDSLEEEL